MKLALTHLFPCTPAEFFQLLEDPELEALQCRVGDMRRDVVEQRQNPDGSRYRRIRCRPNRQLPVFLKPFLGPDGIVYDQVNEWDPRTNLLRWRVEVPAFGERMQVAGTTRLEPHPSGCKRTIEGEVTVKVRLVGGQIEKFVGEDLQKSYDKTARAIAEWMAQRAKQP